MKYFIGILIGLFLGACQMAKTPADFTYDEIQTSHFKLAVWRKITDTNAPYKIYIEGDGHAFNRYGMPTADPTPRGDFWRQAAFKDASANVIYLARPCQYLTDDTCTQTDWTTGRFSKQTLDSIHQAIYKLAGKRPVILIGFSGGAQIAGLTAAMYPDLSVKKIITVAGNLDHAQWTHAKNLMPLSHSLDLNDYRDVFLKFPQIHYVGGKDKIIPPVLTQNFICRNNTPSQNFTQGKNAVIPKIDCANATVILVPDASHQKNWDTVLPLIWAEQ